MSSLLDINYEIETIQSLENDSIKQLLLNIKNKDKKTINLIKSIDEKDKAIKQEKGKEPKHIEKVIKGHLKRAFFYHLKDNRKINSRILSEILNKSIGKDNFNNIIGFKRVFDKLKNTMYKKIQRVRKDKKIQELQKAYPNLKITEAFAFATLKNKFKLKDDDITLFREMIEILMANVEKNSKEKQKNS